LKDRIGRGDNILVAGGTGTGKTTMLNVLADFIPEDERILVIEDTAELHIRKPHVVTASLRRTRTITPSRSTTCSGRSCVIVPTASWSARFAEQRRGRCSTP